MSRGVISVNVVGISSGVGDIGNEIVSDFASVLQQGVDTVISGEESNEFSGDRESIVFKFINPMVEGIFITLDGENVDTISLDLRAGSVEGKGVGVKMDPTRVFREDELSSSAVDTVLFNPVTDGISFIESDVL